MCAVFKIPGQNLSYNVPDDEQAFFAKGDDWKGTIYKRVGNKLQSFNIESLGGKLLEQKGIYNDGKNPDAFRNRGGYAREYLKDQGFNTDNLPVLNLADAM